MPKTEPDLDDQVAKVIVGVAFGIIRLLMLVVFWVLLWRFGVNGLADLVWNGPSKPVACAASCECPKPAPTAAAQ